MPTLSGFGAWSILPLIAGPANPVYATWATVMGSIASLRNYPGGEIGNFLEHRCFANPSRPMRSRACLARQTEASLACARGIEGKGGMDGQREITRDARGRSLARAKQL